MLNYFVLMLYLSMPEGLSNKSDFSLVIQKIPGNYAKGLLFANGVLVGLVCLLSTINTKQINKELFSLDYFVLLDHLSSP